MKDKLNLCYCFPDSFNLHGDRGNMLAFERVCKLLDVEFNFRRVNSFKEKLDFSGDDILFFSPGELRVALGVCRDLQPQRSVFSDYLDAGKTIVVVGTSIALFAKNIVRLDGSVHSGLDLINLGCRERKITYSNDEVFTTTLYGEEMEIVGGQIQMIDILINNETPLGTVSYGYGNSHKDDEGAVKNGLIFTNALGPVFVKNPRFTAAIIIDALRKKGVSREFEIPEFALEAKSNERIKDFIRLKIEKYDASRLEK